MKHRGGLRMNQIGRRHFEIPRLELVADLMRSRTIPAIRKQESSQPLPGEVRSPGDQRDHQNHEIYVLAWAAPERVLDEESQTINHHHNLSENDVSPTHAESQTHRMPKI